MEFRAPLVADPKAVKLMQPCDGALDHPCGSCPSHCRARCSGARSRCRSRVRPRCGDGDRSHSRVGLDYLRPASRTSRPTRDRRDVVEEREQLCDVVAVDLGEEDVQRKALRVREEEVFRAGMAAISWVRPRFFPLPRRGGRSCRRSRAKN